MCARCEASSNSGVPLYLRKHASHRSLDVCGRERKHDKRHQRAACSVTTDPANVKSRPPLLTVHWAHVWVGLCLKLDIVDSALCVDARKGALVPHLIDIVARAEDGHRQAVVLFLVPVVANLVRSQDRSHLIQLAPLFGNVSGKRQEGDETSRMSAKVTM